MDEKHFLLDCTAYREIRQTHLLSQHSGTNSDNDVQQTFHDNRPDDLAKYLREAYAHRDRLVNFRVTKVSLCGMRMTISRGTDKQAPRPSTKLQVEILSNNKLRISRKGQRFQPYEPRARLSSGV